METVTEKASGFDKAKGMVMLREWGGFLASLVVILFSFNTLAFAAFHVPSESMLPTLRVGDHFFAQKFAYGYSRYSTMGVNLPLGEGRLFGSLPERGDVVVFKIPVTEEVYVKRVIGLPGDRIAMDRGRLVLNGEVVERQQINEYSYREHTGSVVRVREFEETLPGGIRHKILERWDDGIVDNLPEITVPEGHFFAMGDNRDNSTDSRYLDKLGFISLSRLLGRVDMVNFTMNPCQPSNGLSCPGGGFTDRLLAMIE